jgi:carbon starvation protein
MPALILLATIATFAVAYRVYGRWLARQVGLDDRRLVPSESQYDGVDHVPARTPVLLGHHFSSIAGAGPVVGPILAGLFFGWVPALLWIVAGSILVGGVHDFTSLIGSIRHRARSVAELAREYMSGRAFKLALAFIWLALVYVIVVFADLTAATFEDVAYNGAGVALSATLFIALALAFGVGMMRTRLPLRLTTIVFLPLVFAAIWVGGEHGIPPAWVPELFGSTRNTWNVLLVLYALIASVTPVWVLLQPRDYLSSFLLYAAVLGGTIGLVLGGLSGGLSASWPAFVSPAMVREAGGVPLGPLFPILFITVACGACSGFHSIVASGTTSKQLRCETDARPVAYGAMLIEGVVAVVALATVMVLPFAGEALRTQPLQVYAAGMGRFLATFGLPESLGAHFGLLALSTFLLTTLDTCTRLGRYVFQEFFGLDNSRASVRWLATVFTLTLPLALLFTTLHDTAGNPVPAWRAIWPVFGATNQLLAGLALLAVTMWLRRTGRRYFFAAAPMAFMVVMTMTALWLLVRGYGLSLIGVIAGTLFLLGIMLIAEAVLALRLPLRQPEAAVWRDVVAAD